MYVIELTEEQRQLMLELIRTEQQKTISTDRQEELEELESLVD